MTKKAKKDIFQIPNFLDNFKKERPRFIFGSLLFVASIYILVAQLSFLSAGASDQSKVRDLSFFEIVKTSSINIENVTGIGGAFFAEELVNKGFGIFSFAIPILGLLIGANLIRLIRLNTLKAVYSSFFFLIWGSLFSSLTLGNLFTQSHIIWGGAHGNFFITYLLRILGGFGTVLLLLASLFIYLVCVKKSLIVLIQKKFGKVSNDDIVALEQEIQEEKINEELAHKKVKKTNWFKRLLTKKDQFMALVNDEDEPVHPQPAQTVTSNETAAENNSFETFNDSEPQVVRPKPGVTNTASSNKGTNDDFEVVIAREEEVVEPLHTSSNHGNSNEPIIVDGEELEEYNPRLDLSHYAFPMNSLLKVYDSGNHQVDMEEQNANKRKIISTLENYGIEITSIKATVGPTITLYEIIPKAGVRISKIRNLEDDIALSLSALGIRIIAPMPGKGTVGIEVPNKDAQIVSMQSVISSKKFQESKGELPVAIGKTITNETFVFDLAKLPHLLVAGATGQGKSVGLNAIITSLLYKKHPAELKMVLIDPKMVEFSIYSTIEKHYLAKLPGEEKAIITDVTKVTQTLTSLTIEMDERYELLMKAGVRNIIEYNEMFKKRKLSPKNGHKFLPYIVIIIDEFGDLIMTAGKEIEMPIARIAQKARAVGMHLIIATQRPTTNIITGTIKANFPARMAFRVMSQIDSRTILDTTGANQLIGRGDLLFSQGSDLVRIQCAFVDTPEVQDITSYIGDQQGYASAHELPEAIVEGGDNLGGVDLNDKDSLFEEAARLIVTHQSGSTSLIQRKFSIGYNRAGRLMDQLEAAGIVGPAQGSKPREVYIMDEYSLEQKLSNL